MKLRTFAPALLALVACSAQAQIGTGEPSSVLVFPKIIADGTRDTIVQISNTSNSVARARCFYVNGAPINPTEPPGPFNPPLWQASTFSLMLTAQQPTNWVVSQGRPVDASDPNCTLLPLDTDCYGAGFDPGGIPSVPSDFRGELFCLLVDISGSPISGNSLTGEATLKQLDGGDVTKYSAIGFAGSESNDGDNVLVLGDEYDACPATWILQHATQGSEVAAVGTGSSRRTDVTIVPCSQDVENLAPSSTIVQFLVINEFEQTLSASMSVDCWSDGPLGGTDPFSVFSFDILGTPTAQTHMRPSSVSQAGFVVLAEQLDSTGGPAPLEASAAVNAHVEGAHSALDSIRIPF